MNYKINDGVCKLDFELSKLEKQLFREFENILESKGFNYLSVPTSIYTDTLTKQDINCNTLVIDNIHILAGSAEQGILEYFSDSYVKPILIYAKNQCFRHENYEYEGLKRCKEFLKLEQYCFCYKNEWENSFEMLLNNATSFLNTYNIKHRIVDVTNKDEGYHIKKYDIEIYTKTYGWLESHSCTYFGEEQTKRFNITGATYTISNTGIASPRILIPFIERSKK